MLKKTIKYTDYNGIERTEDFWFNLNKAEIMEMEMGITGGLTTMINKIIQTQDTPKLVKLFKDLILKAYGEKSADGKRFIKSEELSNEFSQTEAYSELYMELSTSDTAASDFIMGIVPQDAVNAINERGGIENVTKQELNDISKTDGIVSQDALASAT